MLFFLALLLPVLAAGPALADGLTYGPILGRGYTPDQMIVKWGTAAASDASEVQYRVKGAAAFVTATGPASKDHEVLLSGLVPDAQYEYFVQSGATKSDSFGFGACPSPGKRMELVFYGDSRSGESEHQKIVSQVAGKKPELVFESGDLEASGSYAGYLSGFFMSAKSLVASTPFMATPGNHDAAGPLEGNYSLLFPTPRPAGEPWRSYYAFTCGNALFIGLDANQPGDAAQTSFLTARLADAAANATVEHVLVWFHQSAFSPGDHGDDTGVQGAWVAALEGAPKVKAVFSGHDHIYARMAHGKSPIAWVVSGGAGAPLYGASGKSAATTLVAKSTYNFVVLEIVGGLITGTAFDDNGTTLDSFSIGATSVPDGGAAPDAAVPSDAGAAADAMAPPGDAAPSPPGSVDRDLGGGVIPPRGPGSASGGCLLSPTGAAGTTGGLLVGALLVLAAIRSRGGRASDRAGARGVPRTGATARR